MMPADSAIPRWIRELERLAGTRTQLYLYGNVKDTVHYPLGTDEREWTHGSLRDALFELLRYRIGRYEVVASYDLVDGMVFADQSDANTMGATFDSIVGQPAQQQRPSSSRCPQATSPKEPLGEALQQIRTCLSSHEHPCAFILGHASQLVTSPNGMALPERTALLRLLKMSSECQPVRLADSGGAPRTLQHLVLVICDKLGDLPPWLYLGNPFCASLEVDVPRAPERRHFYERYLGESGTAFDLDELVALTDGMCLRDLIGIRALARLPGSQSLNTKALVDCYKYGVQESEWDNLDWRRLQDAEHELERRVIGQPAAVAAVADVLRRARLSLSGAQSAGSSRPRGVLFFAGPTGVGKTELAKAVAQLVFRSDDAFVPFDMSEFSQPHADQRLLGAPPGYVGYEEGGQLTNRVKSNPFCVLLFDEIEKAHPAILDKFLQILGDGRMTDGRGETVYFSESIVIFTSNAGIYRLDPATGRALVDEASHRPILQVDPAVDTEYSQVKAKVTEGVQSYFKHVLGRPELLNRLGQNIIVFDFVRPPVMRQILERKVLRSIADQVAERWQLKVSFAPDLVEQLVTLCCGDVASGGRGVGNLAESALLNPIARLMFEWLQAGQSLAGRSITVTGVTAPKAGQVDDRYEIAWQEGP